MASYTGMRKADRIVVAGYDKLVVHNQFVFEYGPLDQGWWPDSLYTALSDVALQFDINQIKAAVVLTSL